MEISVTQDIPHLETWTGYGAVPSYANDDFAFQLALDN